MTTSFVRIGLAACWVVAAGAVVQAQDAAPQAAAPEAGAESLQGAPASQPRAAKKIVKAVKVIEPLTIAVDWTDVTRLKQLVAVMPGGKVRLVKPAADDADFKVTSTLGDDGRGTKLKLFSEQVHILAGDKILSVADLKDKVVSFGPADGPTRDVARKAFDALGVAVKETPLDFTNAFDGLATGDVDAVVVVAPQPSDYLAGLDSPGLHLVSWPDNVAPPSGAVAGTISGAGYPHLAKSGDTIRAVAVDAVLAMSAKGAKEPAAKAFFASLAQHSAALTKRGFDLLKADLDARNARRVASAEHR